MATHSDEGSIHFLDSFGTHRVQCSRCGYWMYQKHIEEQLTRFCAQDNERLEHWTRQVEKCCDQGVWTLITGSSYQPAFTITRLY